MVNQTNRFGFTATEARRLWLYGPAFLLGGLGTLAADFWAIRHPTWLSAVAIALGAVALVSAAAGLVRLMRTARLRMAAETAQAAHARRGARAA